MGFLDSRSHSLPRPWRVGLALALGVVFAVAYLLNLAPGPEPDGAAYLSMAQQGHWQHAQHLLAGLPLRGLLLAFPAQDPAQLSGVLSAISGGLAVGAACGLGFAMGLGRYGAPLAGALIGLSQGWWAHGTAYEVHILAVGMALLAAAASLQARPKAWAVGGLLALAVLFHKTMVLAVPALVVTSLAGSERRMRDGAQMLGVLGVAVLGTYLLAATSQLDTGRPFVALAEELLLGELREGADRPKNTEIALRARHALAYTLARLPDKSPAREPLTWGFSGALVLWAAVGSMLRWRRLGRGDRALLLWLWPVLALPAIWSFEAGNYEYYLGPVAVLLLLGAGALSGRLSLGLGVPVLALGAWNLGMGTEEVKRPEPHTEQPRRQGPARNPTSG